MSASSSASEGTGGMCDFRKGSLSPGCTFSCNAAERGVSIDDAGTSGASIITTSLVSESSVFTDAGVVGADAAFCIETLRSGVDVEALASLFL